MAPHESNYGHSPHSSSGVAGSSEGTPDTRFTAFSPEDARPIKITGHAITPQRVTQQDPFITSTTKEKAEQKLSATASDFKPYAQNLGNTQPFERDTPHGYSATAALPKAAENLRILIGQMHGRNADAAQASPPKDTSQGSPKQKGNFSTDTSVTRCIQVTSIYQNNIPVEASVAISIEKLLKLGFKRIGSQRVETGDGALFVRYSNIHDAAEVYKALKSDLPKHVVEYITPAAFAASAKSPNRGSYSAHEGQVVLTANYPSGAPHNKRAFEEGLIAVLSAEGDLFAWQKQGATEAGIYKIVAEYCDANFAVRAVERLNRKQIKLAQGDVTLLLELHTPDIQQPPNRHGNLATPTRRSAESSNKANMAEVYGRVPMSTGPGSQAQSEAFASISSPSVLPYLSSRASGFGMQATPLPVVMGGIYGAPVAFSQAYPAGMHVQGHMGVGDFNAYQANGYGHHNFGLVPQDYDHGYSQMGFQPHSYEQGLGHPTALVHHRGGGYQNRSSRRQTSWKVANQGQFGSRRGNGHYAEPDHVSGQHNQVDIHRIKQGIDVRTTVMLRNIPNKIDQETLKQIIDESSFGRYDFMYLRIDFSNDCNVGYAFINFVDPLDIIDFVMARSNQKWHMFRSDKVAEVSYATIQGRDCLIQKFRNSSVMLEPPHYRPKLFFTIHDHDIGVVGEEEEFPTSDNSSKLRRSCENAEHVGLFAPNAGQQLRDDQRRRRSQFDRGTSLAEREENYYDEGPHQGNPSNYRGYQRR